MRERRLRTRDLGRELPYESWGGCPRRSGPRAGWVVPGPRREVARLGAQGLAAVSRAAGGPAPAPLAAVWQSWTTKAGIEVFFAPEAEIDARVDGAFHIHMDPLGAPGWVAWGTPVVAVLAAGVAAAVWRIGIRHYRSTGS